MKIGFIGLGRMGNPMVLQLLKGQHRVVVYNRSPEKVRELVRKGALGASTYAELASKLVSPRIIWLMVPHAAVDEVIANIRPHLRSGDIIVDGGNSNFHESIRRSKDLERSGISYLDIGVSGGTAAAKTGYCMMAGGTRKAYRSVIPLLKSMCVAKGYGHFGPSGAGHYVKMVHNAIEYGMMQAMGEGYDLLKRGPYPDLDLLAVSNVWNNGSIIRGFLMEMNINALTHHPNLKDVPGIVADNGEGKWAVEEAMRHGIPFTINTHALFERYRSRIPESFASKLVAAQRDEFGGHGFANAGKKPLPASPAKKETAAPRSTRA